MAGPRLVLKGVSAKIEGLRWESERHIRVGRLDNLEVVINDPSVSRTHAEIVYTPQGWVLRDCGSSNGTWVNGKVVLGPGQSLQAGDQVKCGNVLLQVEVVCEPKPEPEPPALERIQTSGSFLNLQAAARRSWKQSAEELSRPDEQRAASARHFLTLLRAGHYMSKISSLAELLQAVLDDLVQALNARAGAILLEDPGRGKLEVRAVSVRRGAPGDGAHFSGTLARRCFDRGESILCTNANAEQELLTAQSISNSRMSSIICAFLQSPRRRLGVLHLDRGYLQPPFTQDDFDLVDAIAAGVSVAIESAQLVEEQRELFLRTVTTLAQAVELRDQYTANHTQRVTLYSLMLADELQVMPSERRLIEIGTPLHDIGKIAIADALLRKPGRLTEDEFELMKTHVCRGAAMLANIPGLAPMIPIVRHHHERWDGKGYPDCLAGEQIARSARIVAVADAFDAMTSDRPYRVALPLCKAFAELQAHAGSHFDPDCVKAFLRLRPRIETAYNLERQIAGPGVQPATGAGTPLNLLDVAVGVS